MSLLLLTLHSGVVRRLLFTQSGIVEGVRFFVCGGLVYK